MSGIEGKVAVVTGGASGIGFGIATEFVDQGASVVIADLDQEAVDKAAAAIGPKCSGVAADVTKSADMDALYKKTMDLHGHLDAVVANAGIGDHGALGTITEAQFDRTFNVNVKGVLFTVQCALPFLTEGGSVVIIGSTASIQPPKGMSLYGGAKAAVRNFARTWIQDLKGSGVRVNIVSPGAVDTKSLRTALGQALGEDKVADAVKSMGEDNPIGRIADPREIGRVVAFLSSDASSFVTGVELFADGGLAQF
jgi:NAD(P)-dependent dehydrogenase (short-subunit alcohol dehydrogenase family)